MVTEHNNYLRSMSSLACSHHLGLVLLDDRSFGSPMSRYEARYADYFRAFCSSALTANRYNNRRHSQYTVALPETATGHPAPGDPGDAAESETGGLHHLDLQTRRRTPSGSPRFSTVQLPPEAVSRASAGRLPGREGAMSPRRTVSHPFVGSSAMDALLAPFRLSPHLCRDP